MSTLRSFAGGPRDLLNWSWRFAPGAHNAITDVRGVGVGHHQMVEPDKGICTGVTVLQAPGDLLQEPLPAAVHVINGYGKSTGLVQIAELGQLESPILFTGVYGVGAVLDALVKRLLLAEPGLGNEASGRSINAVVLECNDTYLHDPRAGSPGPADVAAAFADVSFSPPAQGTVGAGVGMGTFGFAGGIGSASRVVHQPTPGHVGALVLTNFGSARDLTIAGRPVGRILDVEQGPSYRRGSVIVALATDLALDSAQLLRLCRRAQNGLARTGCATEGGSGEIVLAFSTARADGVGTPSSALDDAFAATAECVEESVLNALWKAEPVVGRAGRSREALPVDRLPELIADAETGNYPRGSSKYRTGPPQTGS